MRRSLLSCGVDPDHLTCTPGDTPAATLRLAYGLLMHSITGRHALRAHVMDRLARDQRACALKSTRRCGTSRRGRDTRPHLWPRIARKQVCAGFEMVQTLYARAYKLFTPSKPAHIYNLLTEEA
jgi:hypothetical protein